MIRIRIATVVYTRERVMINVTLHKSGLLRCVGAPYAVYEKWYGRLFSREEILFTDGVSHFDMVTEELKKAERAGQCFRYIKSK